MKGFGKVNGIQNLNHIRLMHHFSGFIFDDIFIFIPLWWSFCQHLSALLDQSALRICNDHGTVHLHDRWFYEKTCLTGTTAADDHYIFISCILRLLRSTLHGQCFCCCQWNVHPWIFRHIRLDILCGSPSG